MYMHRTPHHVSHGRCSCLPCHHIQSDVPVYKTVRVPQTFGWDAASSAQFYLDGGKLLCARHPFRALNSSSPCHFTLLATMLQLIHKLCCLLHGAEGNQPEPHIFWLFSDAVSIYTIQHQKTDMNDEVERIWKEAVESILESV
jgi:hypothetical protein